MTGWFLRNWAALRMSSLTALLVLAAVAATWAVARSGAEPGPPGEAVSGGGPLRVAVIGDSFSSGVNSNTVVWTDFLAEDPTLSVSNVARAGSGFVGAVGESGRFAGQITGALASKPEVIVVFGGVYDVGKSGDLIAQSAVELLNDLRTRAPNARMVVVGPIWPQRPAPESVVEVNAVIAEAARQTHTDYVDLLQVDWLDDPALLQDDGDYPNDAGQQMLATRLGERLRTYLTAGGRGA